MSKITDWMRLQIALAKVKSEKDGTECSVSVGDLKNLYKYQDGRCAHTGMRMVLERDSPMSVIIDKVDYEGGWTPDNVLLACRWSVIARERRPINEWRGVVKCIDESRNNRATCVWGDYSREAAEVKAADSPAFAVILDLVDWICDEYWLHAIRLEIGGSTHPYIIIDAAEYYSRWANKRKEKMVHNIENVWCVSVVNDRLIISDKSSFYPRNWTFMNSIPDFIMKPRSRGLATLRKQRPLPPSSKPPKHSAIGIRAVKPLAASGTIGTTLIGYNAGYLTTGSKNVAIGYMSGASYGLVRKEVDFLCELADPDLFDKAYENLRAAMDDMLSGAYLDQRLAEAKSG